MGPVWRLSVVVIVLTLAPMQAWAECAWVLWNRPDGPDAPEAWRVVTGFRTRDDCVRELSVRGARWTSGGWRVTFNGDSRIAATSVQGGVLELMCLPDTVDPRGPKGSGQ